MNTLLTLTVANLKGLIRDRAALFWTFFFPVMFVLLFGVLFSGSSDSKVAVGFVDLDGSVASRGVQTALSGDKVPSDAPGRHARRRKGGDAARRRVGDHRDPVRLRPELAVRQDLGRASSSTRTRRRSTTSQVVQSVCGAAGQQHEPGLRRRQRSSSSEPESLSSTTLANVDYLVPSILAMALMQLGVFAAMPLVQQREKGILKRIGATPLPRWKLVGEQHPAAADSGGRRHGPDPRDRDDRCSTSRSPATCSPWRASSSWARARSWPSASLLASFLKTEEQANGVVQVVQMPLMFLSGIFFPFDFMPDFLRTIARLLPLTYLGDALRQVMVNGTQVAPIGVDLRDPGRLAGGLPGHRGPLVPLGVGEARTNQTPPGVGAPRPGYVWPTFAAICARPCRNPGAEPESRDLLQSPRAIVMSVDALAKSPPNAIAAVASAVLPETASVRTFAAFSWKAAWSALTFA